MSDPWQYIKEGAYATAVVAYSEAIRVRPSVPTFNNRAIAYLLQGNTGQARSDFLSAQALDPVPDKPTHLYSDHPLLWLGTVDWLEGHFEAAATLWHTAVMALTKGRVVYSDAGGGAGTASLLAFAAARLSSAALWQASQTLCAKVLKRPRYRSWPLPLAAFYLNQLPEAELIACPEGPPALVERELCQAHFAVATRRLFLQDPLGASEAFRISAGFRAAVVEREYFLAGYETRRTGGA